MPDLLLDAARRAMHGFMSRSPEDIGNGRKRLWFGASILPARLEHSSWDGGDCTARGLDAWIFLRMMTGDERTGADTEEGQRAYLISLLEPDSDLPRMPDQTSPGPLATIHMWDVGRTLRSFVTSWLHRGDEVSRARAERALASVRRLGVEELIDGKPVLWFAADQYSAGKPIPNVQKKDLWVVRSGQILEPAARLALSTGNERLTDLALCLLRGALSGREPRRDLPAGQELLGPDGSFFGHFHSVSSTLVGMVILARCLKEMGRNEEAVQLVGKAERSYRWIFERERNVNGAGSYGWFPENTGDRGLEDTRAVCETCCTADMLELATELASSASIDPSLARLETIWEDVERFTRNALLKAQWRARPETIGALADLHPKTYDRNCIREIAELMDGAWHDCFYPNEFATALDQSHPFTASTGEKLGMSLGGCCAYSGPRGLLAAWKHAVAEKEGEVSVNLHLDRLAKSVQVRVSRQDDWQTLGIRMRAGTKVLKVLRPSWLAGQTVETAVNGKRPKSLGALAETWWLFSDLHEGDQVQIRYPLIRRTTKEILAPPGGYMFLEPARRVCYTIEWTGNEVASIQPEGRYFPFPPRS